jgi:hypothetical protein
MPKEGYYSLTIKKETAEKLQALAKERGLGLVEFFEDITESLSEVSVKEKIRLNILKELFTSVLGILATLEFRARELEETRIRKAGLTELRIKDLASDSQPLRRTLANARFSLDFERSVLRATDALSKISSLFRPIFKECFEDDYELAERADSMYIAKLRELGAWGRVDERGWALNPFEEFERDAKRLGMELDRLRDLFGDDREVRRLVDAIDPWYKLLAEESRKFGRESLPVEYALRQATSRGKALPERKAAGDSSGCEARPGRTQAERYRKPLNYTN